MKNLKTFYENTIIDYIDFTEYGLSEDMYLYDKIKTVYNIFKSEYMNNNNSKKSEISLFEDWLRGLPTVLTVPFNNFDILNNAKQNKFNLNTDLSEDLFLEYYWSNLSKAFFTLKNNL